MSEVWSGVCVLYAVGKNTSPKRKLRNGPKQANARPARIGACIVPACRTPINGARSVPYNPPSSTASSTEIHRDPPRSSELQPSSEADVGRRDVLAALAEAAVPPRVRGLGLGCGVRLRSGSA